MALITIISTTSFSLNLNIPVSSLSDSLRVHTLYKFSKLLFLHLFEEQYILHCVGACGLVDRDQHQKVWGSISMWNMQSWSCVILSVGQTTHSILTLLTQQWWVTDGKNCV